MNYIILKITQCYSNYLLGENSFVGYLIKTPKDYALEINKYAKIFIYEHLVQVNNKNSFRNEMYGFKTLNERNLFIDLLTINGVGVKIALTILKHDCDLIIQALANSDIDTLCNIKGFNQKLASLAVGLLGSKYAMRFANEQQPKLNNTTKELVNGLKSLGYDKQAINYALNKLQEQKEEVQINELLSLAIKEISLLNAKQ
ncbi:helix-hairpin-helix domain-containing protein [Ureaplasma sp. ES3154-GEN]|uniref:Holliday junction branch migration protein RuvA n=1 Tax=Ureaplasma sp. ES3154-GEN TaxID=2984844 RepID=UPI0021E8531D|nr:Holliday junction branch migration protein RuvA [Ureaplasma sp. ES3154-GEN]MCV3743836.1 helix-hairpin-helix domain-containing protein [Ureaplasma sp. ES3154-GEN]